MRTLFVMSTVALVALLWAAFSIARHVRGARRRRKRVTLDDPNPAASLRSSLRDLSTEAPRPPSLYATQPTIEAPAPTQQAREQVDAVEALDAAGPPAESAFAAVQVQAVQIEVEPPPPGPSAIVTAEERLVTPAALLPTPELRRHDDQPATRPVARTTEEGAGASYPGFPAPSRPSAVHPQSRFARRSTDRPDWAYFNKDMGDLSDPEVPRSKPGGVAPQKDRAGR